MTFRENIVRATSSVTFRVALAVWAIWAIAMTVFDFWHLFSDNWFMSVTMAVGSFIAGSTSEGGGAVAFPVMTLGFGIKPAVARDFSLMIQSIGMTAAAITIFATGIRVELKAIVIASIGALPGFILGAEFIAPLLSPAFTKMFFVTLWLGFGLTLYFRHRFEVRTTTSAIPYLDKRTVLTLLLLGEVGGTISGITGCGLDIVIFSYLVLVRGLDERIATPTSVVLMAVMSVMGFLFRAQGSFTAIPDEAWSYWLVSIPVVVVGAPLGARFIAGRTRNFVISMLLIAIVVQFIGALFIIPMTPALFMFSLATFVGAISLFGSLARSSTDQIWLPVLGAGEEESHA